MEGYCIIYFEHRNDVTSIVKLCLENTSRRRVFSVKLYYACDVISMFKINYTIALHRISVKYSTEDVTKVHSACKVGDSLGVHSTKIPQ